MSLELQPWDDIDVLVRDQIDQYRAINSGVHMSLIATTRGGKTTLATGGGNEGEGLLGYFDDVLVLDTTGDPGAISDYGKGVNRIGAIHGKRRLTVTDMSTETKIKVHKHIQSAVKQGNVAIYADEVRQLADKRYFGLGSVLDTIWLFGAKKGISLIGGTQAPIWMPAAFYDQAKLHFLFHIRDEQRMKRMSEIGGDTKLLKTLLPQLQKHEFIYVDSDGDSAISKFDLEAAQRRASPEKRAVVERERKFGFIRG